MKRKGGLKMAKLTAIKVTKANGEKLIAGYKIALPKVELEKCGFKEGDELKVEVKKEGIRISRK